jgi:hypothetical protein
VADAVVWIDPDEVETVLSTQDDLRVLQGMTGRFMPPVEMISETVPGEDGERLRSVRFGPRDVFIPLLIVGDSESDLRSMLREALPTFNPKRGDGRLRITAPDGSRRELIRCRYRTGLELEETNGATYFRRAGLLFRAFDPLYYDTEGVSFAYSLDAEPQPFFPFFPLAVSASSLIAGVVVPNEGDEQAWPVWTISGPGTDLELTNVTTGKSLQLTHVLSDTSESVTIDTRPGIKSVQDQDGVNLYGDLDPASELWVLEPGDNEVEVVMSGTSPDSLVELSFQQRYLSP